MIKTIEAVVDEHGHIQLLEPVGAGGARRALVMVLDEEPVAASPADTARLSEPVLARDWNRPEEDEAWSSLQQAR